jgi:DNA-directed RNA polymerase specialized sigma24 family protein
MIDFAEVSDDSLLRSLAFSNINAFKVLYHRYYEPLCKFVWTRTESRELMEDIIQEVFTRIWDNRRQLDIQQSFEHYLLDTADSLLKDYSPPYNVKDNSTDQGWIILAAQDIELIWDKIQAHVSDIEELSRQSFLKKVRTVFHQLLHRNN